MGVISGIDGYAMKAGTAIARIRSWTISTTADIQVMIASNTDGAAIQVAGNEDWSGSYIAYGPVPEVRPGDTFQFKGALESTTDKGIETGADGAMVDSVEIAIDQEAGAIIGHTVNFSSNGALTAGVITAPAEDVSTPEVYSSIGCLVKYVAAATIPGAFTELENVRNVTLTLATDNKPYHGSTGGAVAKRTKGNLSGTLSISLYIDDPTLVESMKNNMYFMEVYVSETLKWQVHSIMFNEVGDIGAPRESADYVAVTLTGAFSGWFDGDAAMEKGYIIDPDDAYWFSSA